MGLVGVGMFERDSPRTIRHEAAPQVGAFFDVDNTLHPGPSIEERFYFHLWSKGLVGYREFFQSLLFMFRHFPPLTRQPLREHKLYLNGKQPSVIQPLARAFVEEVILPRISPEAIKVLEGHRSLGHRLVLVTASLDFLVTPLAEWLRVDALLAARPEKREDGFTGRLLPPFPYGEGKRTLVELHAREHDLDLSRSYFYGDSPGDRHVLGAVGHPHVVNPIRGMARIARQQGWPIVKWT